MRAPSINERFTIKFVYRAFLRIGYSPETAIRETARNEQTRAIAESVFAPRYTK